MFGAGLPTPPLIGPKVSSSINHRRRLHHRRGDLRLSNRRGQETRAERMSKKNSAKIADRSPCLLRRHSFYGGRNDRSGNPHSTPTRQSIRSQRFATERSPSMVCPRVGQSISFSLLCAAVALAGVTGCASTRELRTALDRSESSKVKDSHAEDYAAIFAGKATDY